MKSRLTPGFRTLFRKLPLPVQRQAYAAYRKFKQDPYHPSLHFKRLKQQDVYSVRINANYRALGTWDNDAIVWFWIGAHAGYEQEISK
jgi:plasmid maintenance system killer protein